MHTLFRNLLLFLLFINYPFAAYGMACTVIYGEKYFQKLVDLSKKPQEKATWMGIPEDEIQVLLKTGDRDRLSEFLLLLRDYTDDWAVKIKTQNGDDYRTMPFLIYLAKHDRHYALFKRALDLGYDVNEQDHLTNATPLIVAAEEWDFDLVYLLLKKKAKTDLKTHKGADALAVAKEKNEKFSTVQAREIIKLLEDNGSVKELATILKDPIEKIDDAGQARIVNILGAANLIVEQPYLAHIKKSGWYLSPVVSGSELLAAKLFLKYGADSNQQLWDSFLPITPLCCASDQRIAYLLLKHGACLGDKKGLNVIRYLKETRASSGVIALLRNHRAARAFTLFAKRKRTLEEWVIAERRQEAIKNECWDDAVLGSIPSHVLTRIEKMVVWYTFSPIILERQKNPTVPKPTKIDQVMQAVVDSAGVWM